MSTKPVARHPKPAKPAAPSNAKLQKELNTLQGEIRKLQSTATKKHPAAAKPKGKHKATATAKHKPAASAKHGGTKRGLALAGGVACCAAEALAASLRLAGQRVTDDDVLELYFYTASGPADGATIEDTLQAASAFGLAGRRPSWKGLDGAADFWSPAGELGHPARLPDGHRLDDHLGNPGALIIGLELPGAPHTVTLDPSGRVWSWGELYALEELAAGPVEEAWAVSWS